MNLLEDVITYVRRIVKTPSNAQLSDNLIIDYINRFWILDVDARIQLFDLKTKYGFWTSPGRTYYNAPLYGVNQYPAQTEGSSPSTSINSYPVYQGFLGPVYVNGIQGEFYTQRDPFFKVYTPYVQSLPYAATGDGGASYTLSLPFFPALMGNVDITGIISVGSTVDPIIGTSLNVDVPITSLYPMVTITALDGANNSVVITDSGQFLDTNIQVGFLQTSVGSNVQAAGQVNYLTGAVSVTFPSSIPSGNNIQANCYFWNPGIPRAVLFYNNVLTVYPPPNVPYYVELEAYLSPAAFLSTASPLQFGYMSEYIARGAARKILSDTGDVEQFSFYEPLFREQEMLVWKRSQRQFTSTRTQTIFSSPNNQNAGSTNGIGQ